MSNPTSSFGWQMPTASDLVTDLPADFETFGQAVDTSLADLKGGTTGQVLSKASNTDMDFTWVAQDDSNAIQNAIVDAKGDLIAASAADTPARLAVGANYSVLSAQSGETTGLQWASGSTSYSPTWSSYGTQPVLGNGTLTGNWQRYGKLCLVRFYFQAGSTTTFGTTGYAFGLPFVAANDGGVAGNYYQEDYAVNGYRGIISLNDTSNFGLQIQATNSLLSGTNPFTMGSQDFIKGSFVYEVA